MKYLLLINGDPEVEMPADPESPEAWVKEMDASGVRLLGERIRPAAEVTTVRVRGGRTLLTDGPYAETKEQLGGFDVIECANLDEAIEVARRHPMATYGSVEVWPFWTD
jgi:hypothetical protein